MSRKHKNVSTTLNYIKHVVILNSTFSVSTSLLRICIGITSSAIGLKICAIAVGIKKYKSIVEQRKRSMII